MSRMLSFIRALHSNERGATIVEFAMVATPLAILIMGGLDLVRALRAAGRTLPILMVTTRSNRDDILQAVEAGVTGYLHKPFTPQSVREKVEEITGMGLEAGG